MKPSSSPPPPCTRQQDVDSMAGSFGQPPQKVPQYLNQIDQPLQAFEVVSSSHRQRLGTGTSGADSFSVRTPIGAGGTFSGAHVVNSSFEGDCN